MLFLWIGCGCRDVSSGSSHAHRSALSSGVTVTVRTCLVHWGFPAPRMGALGLGNGWHASCGIPSVSNQNRRTHHAGGAMQDWGSRGYVAGRVSAGVGADATGRQGRAHGARIGAVRRDQRGRYGLAHDGHRAGAVDDAARRGAVLCRHGAAQECAQHHGQRAGHRGCGERVVVRGRLLLGLHSRHGLDWRHRAHGARGFGLRPGRGPGGRKPHRTARAGGGVRHVSALLRGHHGGAGGGCLCGAHALFRDAGFHQPVDAMHLRARRALGVGAWGLAGAPGGAGLRRWRRGARECGHGGAGLCVAAGQAAWLWQGGFRTLQPGLDHGGRSAALGRLVWLQRGVGAGR